MPRSKSQRAKDKLTTQQRAFVAEYLVDLNATQAAIRAGYSRKSAMSGGARLLANAKVAAAISAAQASRQSRLQITADRVLLEVARLAFADLRRASKWDEDGVSVVASDDLDDDIAAAISEVGETFGSDGRKGVKIKLHDKGKALAELMDHLGLRGAKKLKLEDPVEAARALSNLLGVDPSKLA